MPRRWVSTNDGSVLKGGCCACGAMLLAALVGLFLAFLVRVALP